MTSLPISLPEGFEACVDAGDKVTVGQIIASNKGPVDEIINIPKALRVDRKQARKVIKKIPGEAVKKGDIIAEKKSLFGTKRVILRSKAAGTVTRFERNTGNLVIRTFSSATAKDVVSPVDGTVAMCDNREIVINTDKNVVIGTSASGDRGQGEIYVLKEGDPYYLSANAIGKVVVSKNFTREMILKGVGIGVEGIIGVEIDEKDIDHLVEKNFKTALIKVGTQDFEKIKQWNGKKVFMNPETESIIFLEL